MQDIFFTLVNGIISGLELALLIRVLLSWIPHTPDHPIVQMLYQVTDPLLRPFQNIVPAWRLGGLDLSPIFAFMALGLLKQILLRLM